MRRMCSRRTRHISLNNPILNHFAAFVQDNNPGHSEPCGGGGFDSCSGMRVHGECLTKLLRQPFVQQRLSRLRPQQQPRHKAYAARDRESVKRISKNRIVRVGQTLGEGLCQRQKHS